VLIDTTPIEDRLRNLQPLEFEQVRRTDRRAVVQQSDGGASLSGLRAAGGRTPEVSGVGARPAGGLPGVVLGPRHLGSRDRYIGWNAEARRRNIRFLAYNTRFLILPWVRVEHLASHILGRMAARISADWQRMYGHPIYFLETFVDPERFRGTCYRAANWVLLGKTTGRGKQSNSRAEPVDQRGSGVSIDEAVSRTAGGRMKSAKPRVDVNLDELDRVLDGAQSKRR
jgi:hypothetical protein